MSFDAPGFGRALRVARDRRRWTQDQLADAAGVRSETISRLERAEGDRQPIMRTVRRLADALEIDVDELLAPAQSPQAASLAERVAVLEDQMRLVIAALPSLTTGPVPGPVESLLRAGALGPDRGSAASRDDSRA